MQRLAQCLAVAGILKSCIGTPLKRQSKNGIVVTPGGTSDIVLSDFSVLSGQYPGNRPPDVTPYVENNLSIDIVNSIGGTVNIYVTAKDDQERVMLLTPDGNWLYPTSNSITVPVPIAQDLGTQLGAQNSSLSIELPGFFHSGRVYFAAGELKFFTLLKDHGGVDLVQPNPLNPSDPSAAVYWGFVEMTYNERGLYANPSYVDFAGLPVSMELSTTDGEPPQRSLGIRKDGVGTICDDLFQRALDDGHPWDQLCQSSVSGTLLRANAPGKYIADHKSAFSSYFESYIDEAWRRFSNEISTIDSQRDDVGNISCSTTSGELVCENASRTFPKPSALEVFGCEGVYGKQDGDNEVTKAIIPRVCAALHRTTLLLPGGEIQPQLPSSSYYQSEPSDWYSHALHAAERDGRGYAFAYDDVNPFGEVDASGAVISVNPKVWTLYTGGGIWDEPETV